MDIIQEITKLKKEKNALILAHNYQDKSIYEVADVIGDSLELAKIAKKTDKAVIVFCGVYFMAETAKILNPQKLVLIPNVEAGCPMADLVEVDKVLELKEKHPKAAVVCYINTTAKVKTVCDICVTSSNAVKVVESLPQREIIFLPDKNLAAFVATQTKKTIIPYDGYCYVHNLFTLADVKRAKQSYPNSKLIVHPEAPPAIWQIADYVCSTSKMINAAKEIKEKDIIIGTETGMIQMLRLEFPEKNFIPLNKKRICKNMKRINLELVLQSLKHDVFAVELEQDTIQKAGVCIEKMLAVP